MKELSESRGSFEKQCYRLERSDKDDMKKNENLFWSKPPHNQYYNEDALEIYKKVTYILLLFSFNRY